MKSEKPMLRIFLSKIQVYSQVHTGHQKPNRAAEQSTSMRPHPSHRLSVALCGAVSKHSAAESRTGPWNKVLACALTPPIDFQRPCVKL
ncbi:hypothetical protein AVEN_60195-1 [Araneus ventricosus]|uniref:Uncharacterized protein n=1 Tax=Araneus ventricosus TaxID=182803 RepID=A0A4Y2CMR1_ARAVE|nr:hypothetical protein AVEN_60195-1 [Araneus ventricosus]